MVVVLAVLSGLALNLAFAPFRFWPAAFLALGSLFYLLLDKNFKERALIAMSFALSFFLVLLHWSGSYVGWFPWVALAFLQTSFFLIFGLFRFERNIFSAIGFASCFLLVELLRMKFPFGGFGWGRIGHTQIFPLSNIYPFVGVAGVTFVTAIIASLVVLIRWKILSLLALLLLSLSIFPSDIANQGKIKVMAVQGGVDKLGLDFNVRALSVLRRHIAATDLSKDVDLVIWPENSSDLDPERNPVAKREISELLQRLSKPLLIGAVERDSKGPLNTAILYRPGGSLTRYIKQDLAPFGEYMPLRNIAERIVPAAKRVKDFQAGSESVLFNLSKDSFSTLICFEILDDDLVRQSTLGASFLVNQTNNATFGRSNQAAQQLQIAASRAAELGRSMISVSTTGFTAHLNSSGKVEEELPQFLSGNLISELTTYEGRTTASRIGSWFWFIIGALGIGARGFNLLIKSR